ncbi:MAG: hypothetical protein ACKO3R_10200 [bacterium]
MNLEFGGNNYVNDRYTLVAYQAKVNTPKLSDTPTEEPTTTLTSKTDGYTSSGTQTNGDYNKLSETLLHGKTYSKEQIRDLNRRLASEDYHVQAEAQEEYTSLANLYSSGGRAKDISLKHTGTPNVKLQYANFDQVYADADGFMYVAGRGLMPWSKDGQKYPTEEQLQAEAKQALKEYLSTAVPVSAENLLSQIKATGQEPTPEEQVKIAELLKQEVDSGSLSKEQIKNIKSKLGDAHVALIPDESPETQSLRKLVGDLVSDLNSRNDSINQAWFKAVNLTNYEEPNPSDLNQQVEMLQKIKNAGGSVAYSPDLESALT